MCIQEDIIDNYAFHFLEDVEEPFVQLIAVGREARHFACYHLENRKRESAYLFQYNSVHQLLVNGTRFFQQLELTEKA